MKYRNDRKTGGALPPFVDPAFAEALTGRPSRGDSRRNARKDHKARQLCRQVQRALAMALAGECDDDVLRELYVADVQPAPDAGHLLVHLVVPTGVSIVDVLERIDRATPRLRATVAHAITRKRAPELSFAPVAAEQEAGHDED